MSSKPPTVLPAELEPTLEFDADGTPVIYAVGEQQLRDRIAVKAYLVELIDGYAIGSLIFLLLAPISVIALIIVALNGYWLALLFPGAILPIYMLLLSSQFAQDGYSNKRIHPLRDLRGTQRRKLFKAWAEASMGTEQSEDELDELQNRLGQIRLEAEGKLKEESRVPVEAQHSLELSKEDSKQAEEIGLGADLQGAQIHRQEAQLDELPYWMGGPIPEGPRPQGPGTLDGPVMS